MNIIIILSPRLNKLKLCGKFFLYDRPRIKTDFAELPRHKKFYEGHEEADVMVEQMKNVQKYYANYFCTVNCTAYKNI